MSHFSCITTKFYNARVLKKRLSDLDITWVASNKKAQDYKTKMYELEIIIRQESKYDISFRWNGNEYELVTDLMFWSQDFSVVKFLNRISQRYAYNLLMETSETKGIQLTQIETAEDGTIQVMLKSFL